jgi:hypothetical protein
MVMLVNRRGTVTGDPLGTLYHVPDEPALLSMLKRRGWEHYDPDAPALDPADTVPPPAGVVTHHTTGVSPTVKDARLPNWPPLRR